MQLNSRLQYKILVALAALAYLTANAIFFPSLTFEPTMIGEMSGLFFYEVNKFGIIESLFKEQCSYLDLAVRLAAAVPYVLNISPKFTANVYALISLLAAIFYTLSFCHYDYRSLIKSDSIRLFIALFILFSYDYDTKVFQGFPYFAIFFTAIQLCYLFVNKDSNRGTWVILLTACDKPLMLIFFPLYFYLYVKKIWTKGALAAMCLMSVQVIFILNTYLNAIQGVCYNPIDQHIFTFLEKIVAIIGYIFAAESNFILGPYIVSATSNSVVASVSLGFLIALCFLVYAARSNNRVARVFISIGMAMVVFNSFILCIAFQNVWNIRFDLVTSGGLFKMWRHLIPFYIGAIFQVVGVMLGLFNNKPSKVVFLGLLIWFVLSGNAVRPAYEYKNIEFPLLGSGGYFPALSLDELMSDKECVPVDPFPFVMNERGCKVLINGDPWSKAYLNASDLKVVGISDQFHSELEGAEIVGIGIIAQALEGNTVEYKLIIDDEISNNVYKNSYHHKDAEKYLVFIKTDLLKFNFNSLYIKTDKNVNFLKANSKENSPILIAFYYKK